MTKDHAKQILKQSRANIGALLSEFRKVADNPDNFSLARQVQLKRDLGANIAQQASIYRSFPALRPQRVEQLKLAL